ncbi:MAG: replicative DNA helicase [bacterium]
MATQDNDNIGRMPPQNIEAEQSLLGSLLIDKEAVIKIADIVKPHDFYKQNHGLIFEAMEDLYAKHEPIDILSVTNRLEEKKQIESVGGRNYLMQLSNAVPTASHVLHYANIVHKKATLRRLLETAGLIGELVFNEEEDLDVVLDKAEKHLFGVSQNYGSQAFVPIKNVLEQAFDRIDELHREKGKLRGIATNFTALDNLLSGLQKSDLVILAARPSVGKTSMALDIARQAAKNGKSVGVFSLEMSKEQLVDRLICAEANIDLWKMRTGKLTESSDDFTRIGNALGTLSEIPLYIDDAASSNIMDIRTRARRLQMEHGLDMIVIDYLQLLESRNSRGSSDNRVQEVAEITRGLKAVARELNIPVLALSQLSRAVEASKPAIPKLSHLRESGSIEQDADVVMFIYRKSADRNYRPEDIDPQERNIAEIHIAKHRNGPTGEIKLYFDEHRVCFKNLETKMAPHANYEKNSSANLPPPKQIQEPPF